MVTSTGLWFRLSNNLPFGFSQSHTLRVGKAGSKTGFSYMCKNSLCWSFLVVPPWQKSLTWTL